MSFVESLGSVARQLFESGGWTPGRDVSAAFCPRPAGPEGLIAFEVLSEVGHLTVGTTGPGRDCSAGDVEFTNRFGPERASIVQALYQGVGNISAIGEAHRSYTWLFVNARGSVLAFTDVDEKLYVAGQSVAQSIERLLLGHRWNYPWS